MPLRSVQHHAKVDGWHERADRLAEELAADARASARVGLYAATADAVAALARIASGEGEPRTVLDRDGHAAEVTDPVPYQARVNAANSILDRVGVAAVSRTVVEAEPRRRAEDDALDLEAYCKLPPEERRRIVNARGGHA